MGAFLQYIVVNQTAVCCTDLIQVMARCSISCGPWGAGTTAEVWGLLKWATLHTCTETASVLRKMYM
jgi:hypothetical protein